MLVEFVYRVLPTYNVATQFLKAKPGMWTEKDLWFDDIEYNYGIGQIFSRFAQLVNDNKDYAGIWCSDKKIPCTCFLLKLAPNYKPGKKLPSIFT